MEGKNCFVCVCVCYGMNDFSSGNPYSSGLFSVALVALALSKGKRRSGLLKKSEVVKEKNERT